MTIVVVKLTSKNPKRRFNDECVHRLVALAWIGKPSKNKTCVNHKNLDKTDNYYKNLEWCTHKENSQHAVRNGVQFGRLGACKKRQGENNGRAKLNWKNVKYIRNQYNRKKFTGVALATMFNVHSSIIYDIINNKAWKV